MGHTVKDAVYRGSLTTTAVITVWCVRSDGTRVHEDRHVGIYIYIYIISLVTFELLPIKQLEPVYCKLSTKCVCAHK